MPTEPPAVAPRDRQQSARGDIVAALAGALLVAVAIVVPFLASDEYQRSLFAKVAPLFGDWLPHYGPGSALAMIVAAVVIWQGPSFAARARFGFLLAASWAAAAAWMISLALIDGWERGVVNRLTDPHEYLHEVPGIDSISGLVSGFTARILDGQPDSWTTHVSGHPVGAILSYVVLDRVGLGGGAWAGMLSLLAGSSAIVAILVTLRALGSEAGARAAAPFLVLAPAAIWVVASADGYFMGVAAWGIALLALATNRRGRGAWALAFPAGLLLGFGVYLNYGLVLMGVLAVAVLLAARTARPLLPALAGALLVAGLFTWAGFWWFEGLHLVVDRYYQGIASIRPISYWGWANYAATVCVIGLASVAALPRALRLSRLRSRDAVSVMVAAGILAILLAGISALSKAETERIWLPFTIWICTAPALLPMQHHRRWLIVQAVIALAINHLVLTRW
ncbi:hypothetical protein HT102_00780 [Hoyosella sp. G463]|uniref:Integral membrane protein n=1 Tax=Lolliginicoccus lacisalsi TaxID=2742202 RepID=A0A927PJW7_9ACTN|nr:hypothetical protein [Lolliginicoccus lacisalsi]MBD8505023.1 hypothetical protein [Lolliginicoccus lacisalsi]